MTYSELISLYFERSNAIQSYWTVYVVVIGGLLAFSSLRKDPDLSTTVLIAVLYSCFAYKNCGAIEDASYQRIAVLGAIKQSAVAGSATNSETDGSSVVPVKRLIEPTLNPPDVDGIKHFHLFSDVLTLVILGAMEARRRRLAVIRGRTA